MHDSTKQYKFLSLHIHKRSKSTKQYKENQPNNINFCKDMRLIIYKLTRYIFCKEGNTSKKEIHRIT